MFNCVDNQNGVWYEAVYLNLGVIPEHAVRQLHEGYQRKAMWSPMRLAGSSASCGLNPTDPSVSHIKTLRTQRGTIS